MEPSDHDRAEAPLGPARRHFLKLAGAMGARVTLALRGSAQEPPPAAEAPGRAAGEGDLPRRALGRTGVQV